MEIRKLQHFDLVLVSINRTSFCQPKNHNQIAHSAMHVKVICQIFIFNLLNGSVSGILGKTRYKIFRKCKRVIWFYTLNRIILNV